MNKCTKCKQEKPLTEFYWRDKERKIPSTYCKACNKEHTKSWRKTIGKDKWKAGVKRQRDKVKAWINEQKALGCERCGDSRFYVIDFHHIDPTTKKFTIGSGYANSNLKQTKEEVAKCKRLCANCHREVHFLQEL